jgi:hypothetical protein
MIAIGSSLVSEGAGWAPEGEFSRDDAAAEPEVADGTTRRGRSEGPDMMSVPAYPVSSIALSMANESLMQVDS